MGITQLKWHRQEAHTSHLTPVLVFSEHLAQDAPQRCSSSLLLALSLSASVVVRKVTWMVDCLQHDENNRSIVCLQSLYCLSRCGVIGCRQGAMESYRYYRLLCIYGVCSSSCRQNTSLDLQRWSCNDRG